jgi:hypothetical protein
MATRGTLVTALIAALGACSPFGGNAFSCTDDMQCGAGKCMASFCAFPDQSCSSGFKFSDSSGTLSNTCVTDSNDVDAQPGSDTSTSADNKCYGTGFGKVCFAPADAPAATLEINTALSTDGSMCSTKVVDAPPWCVIAATDLTLDAGTIAVTGSKPLVLVATGTLTVNGMLDAASHRMPAQAGPGHDPAAMCDAGTPPTGNGGGAGGSFGSVGGGGGDGNNQNNSGGTSGLVEGAAMRGGCLGQDGKAGAPADAGTGGFGGGAVYLIAGTEIIVSGAINASGASGSTGTNNKGGGGAGGSGGLIGLDSQTVIATGGFIFANGGGGGEGASAGNPGDNGNESINGAPAQGAGSHPGGDGGAGAAQGATVGDGGNSGDGGGGGGGGVGAIRLYQATSITGGTVSPAPTP